jgi:ribosome-associated protein
MEVKKIKKLIENTLNKNKANNIVIIDLKRKSYIADYMIVASGTSSRHLQSLSENLLSELKNNGLGNCRIEGYESNDWKLVDAIDVIVHLFHPEKRAFYDLEKMWSEDLPKEKALI